MLLSLAREKIVTLFPGRGAFVAAPTHIEAHEVLAARRVLEVGLLDQTPLPPAAAPTLLHQILAAERAATERANRIDMIRQSGAFHVALARWLGNEVVAEMLQHLILRSSLAIALYEPRTGICCLVDDHLAILTAITAGRTSDATSLMKQHLQHIEDELDFSRQATPRLNLVEILQDP